MRKSIREEKLLEAWVGLSALLKNSRLTDEMAYNEAVIMLSMYRQYQKDGIGEVAVSDLVSNTKMLKSLLNRTINALENNGRLKKIKHDDDSRRLYVKPTRKGVERFLLVHDKSLALAKRVIKVIGAQDADAVIRAYEKLRLVDD